eukprot:COSAG01_NODE_46_length_32080_cov_716.589319_12_plen_211_part_00
MNQVITSLASYFNEHWPELLWIAIVATGASLWANKRAHTKWQNREFLDRLNVSLTTIMDGRMFIRTILEIDSQKILLNPTAAKTIATYAKLTTVDNPILPFPIGQHWDYLNPILNELSSQYSEAYIRRDLGQKVTSDIYLLCLTCEKNGPVKTQKVRALLTKKSLLEALPEEEPMSESESHRIRFQTLKQLAEQYKSAPSSFVEFEICFN